MPYDYFGFAEPPFSLTPDPRFFFRSASHELALGELHRAIDRREGFLVLTGDVGTGKTTLCRTLLEQLGPRTFTALVLNPFVDEIDLLKVVLQDFGVVSRDQVWRGGLAHASKQDLIDVLNQFLLSLAAVGASAVLLIDEAQNLPIKTLEQIRVLTNLETDRQKLLQIVLVGQLELLAILARAEMRQLDQRISRRCRLEPLTRGETDAYIAHRLWVARGQISVHFPPKTLEAVHRLSGGVPRQINLLCDRALEAAQAASQGTVAPPFVHQAAVQLGLEAPRRRSSDRRQAFVRRFAGRAAAAAVIIVALLAGGYVGLRYFGSASTDPGAVGLTAGAPPADPAGAGAADAGAQTPGTGFSILVGAYATRAEADKAAAQLKTQGYLVRDIVATEGRAEFRVLVGRYPDVVLARQHAERLRRDPLFGSATIVTDQ